VTRLYAANADELVGDGMWLESPIGVSWVCRCNWRSGIKPTHNEVAEAIHAHYAERHG